MSNRRGENLGGYLRGERDLALLCAGSDVIYRKRDAQSDIETNLRAFTPRTPQVEPILHLVLLR